MTSTWPQRSGRRSRGRMPCLTLCCASPTAVRVRIGTNKQALTTCYTPLLPCCCFCCCCCCCCWQWRLLVRGLGLCCQARFRCMGCCFLAAAVGCCCWLARSPPRSSVRAFLWLACTRPCTFCCCQPRPLPFTKQRLSLPPVVVWHCASRGFEALAHFTGM